MAHRIKGLAQIDNPLIRSSSVSLPGTLVTKSKRTAALIIKEEYILSAVAVAMTDAGASGAFGSVALCTLPARNVLVIGCEVDLTAFSRVGTNITATATVKCAVGTSAEATDDTLNSVQACILASQSASAMVAGAGALSKKAGGSAAGAAPTPLVIDASSGTQQLFLNFGIADAGSAGNDTLTVTGSVRLVLVDLGA